MILLEPPTEDRRTGGYRLNAAICRDVPEMTRLTVSPGALPRRPGPTAGRASREIVFVDSLYLRHPVAMGALLRLRRQGVRLVLLAHLLPSQEQPGRFRRHPRAREREDRALSAFRGALVPSRFMAECLRKRGFEATRLALLRPDEAVVRPLQEDRGSPLLLSVANLSPVKYLHSILPALAQLQALPWRWEIIGSRRSGPRYCRYFRRIAGMYGLGGRVRLRGPAHPHQLSFRIAQARAVLVPSRFESFGLVARQSLLAGAAVLASRVGGLPEALTPEGDDGPHSFRATDSPAVWLLPPGDTGAWVAALQEVLTEQVPRGTQRPALAAAPPLRAESPGAATRRLIRVLQEEQD